MQGVGKSKCVVYMAHGMHRVHATYGIPYGVHMALGRPTVEHAWEISRFGFVEI